MKLGILTQPLYDNYGGLLQNYALQQILKGGVSRTGVASAVTVIMMIVPITAFILSQRQITETMASSGIKD